MSIPAIIAAVAEEHGLTPSDITGRSCVHKIAHARQEVMWRARQVRRPSGAHRYSLPFIGKTLKRDHSTVWAGVRAHERRREHKANIPYHLPVGGERNDPGTAKHLRVTP